MLATYYILSKDNAPTPEEMRQKSREYMLITHTQKAGTCKGEASHKFRHGTKLETTWKNVGLAQVVDQRIIKWRIPRHTTGHEELGIRTGIRGHESNEGT